MCDHYTQKFKECDHAVDLWDSFAPGHGMNGTYGDYMYVGRAVETINSHDVSTPLFYYLALQVAHDPVESPARFQAEYDPSTCPDVG